MDENFNFTLSPEGIGTIVFDLKGEKVNKLSIPVLEELERMIDGIAQNKNIKLLAIKSAKDVFIAGADLHSFEPAFKEPALAEKIISAGHRVFAKISALPFPTVAVINGACLGGGLELALSCTYRLVTDNPKTSLGLPEVNLGLFPGWGGTQRLPRLVGLENGLNMILGGRPVNGLKAFKMGLADHIFAAPFLADQLPNFLKGLLTPQGQKKLDQRREQKPFRRLALESNALGRWFVFKGARSQVMEKTKGRYPAPLLALSVIEDTYTLPLQEGLKKEADMFTQNISEGLAKSRYLIPLFFTQEALKKDTGVNGETSIKPIKEAAVIGAGTMGATLAWLLTNNYLLTRLKDISWELIGKGYGVAKSLYQKGVKTRKATPSEADRKFNLLSGTIDYSGFQHADIIIEAAVENLDLKKKIFAEVEKAAPKDAIIASNTSSLTIEEMAEGMQNPERFIGMHFFNPPNKMPLVEVVAGPKSSPSAIASAVDLAKKLGKTPIVVKDCHGFLVNRIFVQGANEVIYLLQENMPQEVIIKKLLDFGMPMDPFLLADEVGNDVAYKVTKAFEKAYGERMKGPELLDKLFAEKLFGKKTGKGFYLYKDSKLNGENPQIKTMLHAINASRLSTDPEDIIPRFTLVMINEAARCLEEGIVTKPSYLDMALIMGIGFPPYRGGLLKYADEQGIAKIVSQLEAYEKKYGIRFKPAELLIKMKNEGRIFY